MKKALMLVVMLVAVCGLNAQSLLRTSSTHGYHPRSVARYQGEIDFGYSVGVGLDASGRISLHTVHGAKFNNFFSAGLGLGLDYYQDSYDGEMFVPVFANVKFYLPVDAKLSPFASFDVGYGIGATHEVRGKGGFLWAPSFGIKYDHFKFQIGYTSQRVSVSKLPYSLCAVQFKVGIVF